MVPKSSQAVLGTPEHGGMIRRILRLPFQAVPGCDADRYPIAQKFQYGGRFDDLNLDHDCEEKGCGIRWILDGDP